jgi:hypothetical protein
MKAGIICILFITVCNPLDAQWSNDPSVNTVVCDTVGTQSLPLSISDGLGGVIIIWNDFREGFVALYAQRFNSFGQQMWRRNGVPVYQADTIQSPFMFSKDAISDGSGGAIICWSARPMGSLTGFDVFVQRIDANGSPLWQPTNGYPLCSASGHQWQPSICRDGEGGAIVAWTDGRLSLFNPDIYAHRISAEGLPLWQPTNGAPVCRVPGLTPKGVPLLSPNPPGGAIIVWMDGRRSVTFLEPYLQRMNSSSERMWDTSGISASSLTENKIIAGIVPDGAGGAILGWQQSFSVSGYLVAQRVDSSGNLLWGNEGELVVPQSRVNVPKLVSDRAGGAIFVWRDVRDSGTTGEDLYVQRLDGDRNRRWNPNGVPICRAAGNQFLISLVSSEDSGAVVAWQDYRNGDTNSDIYAQKIRHNGIVTGPQNGIAVCTAPSNQQRPSLVSDGTGGGIVAWEDSRSKSLDIYSQHLASIGLGSLQSAVVPGPNIPMTFTAGEEPALTTVFTSLGAVDVVVDTMTVSIFLNVQVPNLTKALPRYLDLSVTSSNFSATLTFNYTEQEVLYAGLVNGDANLKLYRDGGSGWELMGGTVDTAANTVTITGVTAFSRWAMRDPTDTIAVGVREEDDLPQRFALHQNYPNPFNPTTTIGYNIGGVVALSGANFSGVEGRASTNVRLAIYDLLGREVATLVNEVKAPGRYEVTWDASGLASGVYLYRLTAGSFVDVKKLLLLK